MMFYIDKKTGQVKSEATGHTVICHSCDSDAIDYSLEYLVSGEVGGPMEAVHRGKCRICGHEMILKD